MADIIQQRRDTAARWAQYNPILLEGEVGYVTDNPNQYKIGNGRDKWNDLPLRGYTGTITQDTGDDENAVMSQKAVTDKLSELGSEVGVEKTTSARATKGPQWLTFPFIAKKGETLRIKAEANGVISSDTKNGLYGNETHYHVGDVADGSIIEFTLTEDITQFIMYLQSGNFISEGDVVLIVSNAKSLEARIDKAEYNIKNKVDSIEGKSLISKGYADGIHVVENEDYIEVEVDSNNNIHHLVRRDGTHYFPKIEIPVIDKAKERIYRISKNGNGDFQSVTECFRALKDDTSVKTIYIESGIYDIFEEIGGARYVASLTGQENWRDVCDIVPENTNLIGLGIVELVFEPTYEQMGSSDAKCFLFSPLNVSNNCRVENITVRAANCRYAIHDEGSADSKYTDKVHEYINVRAYKTKNVNTGELPQVFGSGLGFRCIWKFENCEFRSNVGYSIWTCHTNTSDKELSGFINFDNCIFEAFDAEAHLNNNMVRFISAANKDVANRVKMSNCVVRGNIIEETDDANVYQSFDLTLLNTKCNAVNVGNNFVANNNPIKIY